MQTFSSNMIPRTGLLVLVLGSLVAVDAQRVCEDGAAGGCTAPPCPGGDLEAWVNCGSGGNVASSSAECGTGCALKPIEGSTEAGLCVVEGFESGEVPALTIGTLAADECADIFAGPDACFEAFIEIVEISGCTDACSSEISLVADACGDVTGTCSAAPANSCDGIGSTTDTSTTAFAPTATVAVADAPFAASPPQSDRSLPTTGTSADDRVCEVGSSGGCTSPSCPGGDLEAWDNCGAGFDIQGSAAECGVGCALKPIEGSTELGICVPEGFEDGEVPALVIGTLASDECTSGELSDGPPECIDAFVELSQISGCSGACVSEIGLAADACGEVTGTCSAAPAHSCDDIGFVTITPSPPTTTDTDTTAGTTSGTTGTTDTDTTGESGTDSATPDTDATSFDVPTSDTDADDTTVAVTGGGDADDDGVELTAGAAAAIVGPAAAVVAMVAALMA